MSITLFAKVVAKEGSEEALRGAIVSLVEAASEEEGLITYRSHQDDAEPAVFWFYEVYVDEDALAVHGRGERMRVAMGVLGDLLASRPEVHQVTSVASKG